MLNEQIDRILIQNPEYVPIIPVLEKEILHHDIMDVLVRQGAMRRLVFIGGTSLRLCFNSTRLSEDLDFNAGHDFRPADFDGLEIEIQRYLQKKYEIEVWVNKPQPSRQGNTSSWTISIVKEANRPDLPRQKMHIDVCAIPSFDIEKRPLINHYHLLLPTEGLLFPVQSLAETYVDKLIALAWRTRRIKPRDIWDLVWLRQKGIRLKKPLLKQKLSSREKTEDELQAALRQQLDKLFADTEVKTDFYQEMSRFIPSHIKERTLDQPEYWSYVQAEVKSMVNEVLDASPTQRFDMG